MRVVVTQDDIDAGQRKRADSCPVARALLKFYPGVKVYDSQWKAQYGVFKYLPAIVRRFIKRFDHGKSVKPFEFNI